MMQYMPGDAEPLALPLVQQMLLQSPNAGDRRKGRDLAQLAELEAGQWAGLFRLRGARPGPQRTLCILADLHVCGLVWDGTAPRIHNDWQLLLGVLHSYPLAEPAAAFSGAPTPFNPHVLDKNFAPQASGLAPEMRRFLTAAHDGACCWTVASQWRPTLSYTLALVVRQVSRILTGSLLYCEKYSLNDLANDHYLVLAREGRLPLGPSLPVPRDPGTPAPQALDGDDEDPIAWYEGSGEQNIGK